MNHAEAIRIAAETAAKTATQTGVNQNEIFIFVPMFFSGFIRQIQSRNCIDTIFGVECKNFQLRINTIQLYAYYLISVYFNSIYEEIKLKFTCEFQSQLAVTRVDNEIKKASLINAEQKTKKNATKKANKKIAKIKTAQANKVSNMDLIAKATVNRTVIINKAEDQIEADKIAQIEADKKAKEKEDKKAKTKSATATEFKTDKVDEEAPSTQKHSECEDDKSKYSSSSSFYTSDKYKTHIDTTKIKDELFTKEIQDLDNNNSYNVNMTNFETNTTNGTWIISIILLLASLVISVLISIRFAFSQKSEYKKQDKSKLHKK
jgi:hypothetical protein